LISKESHTYFLSWSLSHFNVSNFVRIDWSDLLTFAKKQAIAGVYWQGIQKLGEGEENPLSEDEVVEWWGEYQRIWKRNRLVYKKDAWVCKNFEHEGFKACVLKGQGNALMYPDKMERVSGDIDVMRGLETTL